MIKSWIPPNTKLEINEETMLLVRSEYHHKKISFQIADYKFEHSRIVFSALASSSSTSVTTKAKLYCVKRTT